MCVGGGGGGGRTRSSDWEPDVFELFCVNKIALCQHEGQEILPW